MKPDPNNKKYWDAICTCGHTRVQHWVGGPASDCDKCSCRKFRLEKG
jgi:hypothetical protein